MSLKARLRLAVALLMSATVVVLSGIYMRGFLDESFARTYEIADSLANQLQAALVETLQRRAVEATPRPVTADEARNFWLRTVDSDPNISGVLERAARHWQLISEIFITDQTGRIRASSVPGRTGRQAASVPNLAEWTSRSLVDSIRQVYFYRRDAEVRRPLAIRGEKTPVLEIHVVVSSVFLVHFLRGSVEGAAKLSIACLVMSIVLALVLPNFVLSPLERLGHSIDLISEGRPATGPTPKREAREVAQVYSKLNLLGKQFMGARETGDQWRGSVEQLLQRLDEAVLLFDASGRLTLAGTAVRRLLGRDPAELTGLHLDEIFSPATEIGAIIGQAVAAGESVQDATLSLATGGHEYSVLLSVQPLLRVKSGQRMGTLVTMRDAETRGELRAQLDVAARLTALSQLTHGVAHEIKNPLNAIRLHLEVLRTRLEGELPEVDVIAREISRLDRVVKTFLDFNRPVRLHRQAIDLNDLTRDLAALVALDATARDIRIEVRPAHQPAIVNGDRDLLQQAVLNVVMNAVEAMSNGGDLLLETRCTDGEVELLVSDTGPGIPPEIREKIFNLYFSTKTRGSGIGLSMTFRFVQLHDGKIEVSSEIGHGTTFRFTFPEAPSSAETGIELSRTHRA